MKKVACKSITQAFQQHGRQCSPQKGLNKTNGKETEKRQDY